MSSIFHFTKIYSPTSIDALNRLYFLQNFKTELSKAHNSEFTNEQKGKIFSLINYGKQFFQSSPPIQNPSELTFEKARSIFITFLRHSDEKFIASVLDLDSLQHDDPATADKIRSRMLFCFKNASSDLDLSSLNITSLPDSLHYFDHLRSLNLRTNHLTTLPTLPKSLKYFDGSQNQLTSLSDHLPPELETLHVEQNQLTRLPSNLPPTLKDLDVSWNRLTSLPDIDHTALESFKCIDNRISSLSRLPITLLTLLSYGNRLRSLPSPLPPHLVTLGVGRNRLSKIHSLPLTLENLIINENLLTELPPFPKTLKMLECESNKLTWLHPFPDGLEVFRGEDNFITKFPPFPETLTVLEHDNQHSQLIQNFQSQVDDPSLKALNLENFAPDLHANINIWLENLEKTNEFNHQLFGKIFSTNVLTILKHAQTNEDYCENIFAPRIEDSISTCEDASTYPINELVIQKTIHENKNGSLDFLQQTLKDHFALLEINKIAANYMEHHPKQKDGRDTDEVQVYFGFQTEMNKRLHLSFAVNIMTFEHYIDDETLDLAEHQMKTTLNNKNKFTEYLISQSIWTERLKNDFRTELGLDHFQELSFMLFDYKNLKKDQRASLHDELKNYIKIENNELFLTENQILEAHSQIAKYRAITETEWLKGKTTKILSEQTTETT